MKLSVITINFNNLIGLRRTYDSIVSQTFNDYEWIIIDGGSTDGSREFVKQHQDDFAYWCSEPDKGIYNAMNKGVAKAIGEYVIFINSGDCLYDSSTLGKVFAEEMEIGADIISGQVVREDNGKFLRTYDENVFMQIYTDTLNHQGTFIRRTLFDKYKYDENLKIVSDWKFWIEAIVFSNAKIVYTDLIVAKQDMVGLSSSPLLYQEQIKERSKVLDVFFPPMLKTQLDNYSTLYKAEYVTNNIYLLQHCHCAYRLSRRFISFLIKCIKIYKKLR